MSTTSQHEDTDKSAILALVLAFLVPPVGLLVAIYGKGEGKMSGLRVGAVAVGVVGTVLGALLLIMLLGVVNAPTQ